MIRLSLPEAQRGYIYPLLRAWKPKVLGNEEMNKKKQKEETNTIKEMNRMNKMNDCTSKEI